MANKSTIPSSSNINLKSSRCNKAINIIQLLSSRNESSTDRGDGGNNIRETLQSQLFLTPSPQNNHGNVMIGGASREMQMMHGHFSQVSSSSSSSSSSPSSSIVDDIINEISKNPKLKIDPITFLKPSLDNSGHPILLSVSSHLPPPNENWTTILTINPTVGLCLHQIKNPDTPTTTGIGNGGSASNDSSGSKICSVPYKKNGPYTCSRCKEVFATSQKFAAHTQTHYKYQTKDEKKKRVLSKIRKRNFCPQMVNTELTLGPPSSQDQAVSGGVSDHVNGCGRIRRPNVEVEVDQDRAAAHVDGVKVKSEHAHV